jgi:hypothetical protein
MTARPFKFTIMTLYVTLQEAKKQVNVPFTDDDDYITSLIEAAQIIVEKDIQQDLTNFVTDGALNRALCQAILLIFANLYANREPVAYAIPQTIPYTYAFLIMPFIKLT